MQARVQDITFDFANEVAAFEASVPGAGAIVTFSGIVRPNEDGTLRAMEIEHYPGMTQRQLTAFTQAAIDRFALSGALVIHRYGHLEVGEKIMMVATAARHRKDAFSAADFLMDYLKSRAPFWKKEITDDGAGWVASKQSDEDALEGWAEAQAAT